MQVAISICREDKAFQRQGAEPIGCLSLCGFRIGSENNDGLSRAEVHVIRDFGLELMGEEGGKGRHRCDENAQAGSEYWSR